MSSDLDTAWSSFDSRHVSCRDDLYGEMYLPGTTVPWRAGPWTGSEVARLCFFDDGTGRPAADADQNRWRRADNRRTRRTRHRSRASCASSHVAAGTSAPATESIPDLQRAFLCHRYDRLRATSSRYKLE